MTREEAIKHGQEQLEVFGGEHKEFIELAIKALEQEPCEDAISKEEVLHRIKVRSDITMDRADETDPWIKGYDAGIEDAIGMIETVPSVPPKVKTGHWRSDGHGHIYCDVCNATNLTVHKSKFCPDCGAKMIEQKESEDKE